MTPSLPCPPPSPPSPSSGANTNSTTPATPSSNNTNKSNNSKRDEKLKGQKRKQRQEKILRRAIPILLTVPWFLGLIWTALHPLVSVITGELKCRGQYIDENGLDVHRHRVESYPLERAVLLPKKLRRKGEDEFTGMCDAIYSTRLPTISPSIECLHHEVTETIAFDVVRILPSMGPIIESAEAVVLVVGEDHHNGTPSSSQGNNKDSSKNKRGDWYERSDINASILHLIKKLGNKKDCPWLTKTVFIVSPSAKITATTTTEESTGNRTSSSSSIQDDKITSPPHLGSIVDAFIASYLGGNDSSVRPLPPDFTFPMIRSLLVLSDNVINVETTNNHRSSTTDVRILPQGMGGTLPNLDLVFATFLSLKSYPAGDTFNRAQSIYYGDSEVSSHPFVTGGGMLEERVGRVLAKVGDIMGLKGSSVEQYAKDLVGLFGFVAALVIGPRQPHASALNHGIDALTIELRIPNNAQPDTSSSSSSIHPHYADVTRSIEHLLHSISNLHERLHHSIAQYIMPSPSKFISHGEYIYPAILVCVPMIVRAASLALKDLKRFQFLYVGVVVGSVGVATFVVGLWASIIGTNDGRWKAEGGECCSEWISYIVFFVSYLLVVLAARQADTNKQTKQQTQSNNSNECRRGSLRFIACLLGIYLHAPLLLANYSLGFPSSAFWAPLLATLVLPSSLQMVVSRNKVFWIVTLVGKGLFLVATSPPVLLVPRIFPMYTPYVLCVYTPLHLLLAALWLA
eukprot:CAMPEP_0201910832 /NCGR_PEP_ID=MMETSP0903-20130614/2049_1 /ASSEMBLY_ACC=CAM_ASM_000552 /TAXON_ID=420261 /ORGANISM="Thalassiosira antarctica, Strain CCMP982" /LENGTH=741 /DNA_ID=CAMNT_0048445509 /DNA_START=67 /DNA_END=2292 /DNA_ORIENTATION=+